MSKTTERGFDINERYTKLSQLEHVLARPDTYVGGTDAVEVEAWVWDKEQSLIVRRKVRYPPALLKIFDEILVNARDHSVRDQECTRIKVTLDPETGSISVENNGAGIPVEMHEEGCMLPELIFGRFMAGENFSDEEQKVVGGRNGLGSKVSSAFSTRFEVDTVDKVTNKRYVQVWEKNMSIRHDPLIETCRKAPYTKVTFTPDYQRFAGCDGLNADVMSLLVRRVYDLAACTGEQVLIYLNGEKLAIRNFEKYMNLYLGDSKSAVPRVYAELENDDGHPDIKSWQFGIALSDDGFKHVSFVNGIATSDGGTHVNYLRDKLVRQLGKLIRDKNPNTPMKPAYIRENMMLFVNAVVVNPAFSSQVKECLTTDSAKFGYKHTMPDDLIDSIEKRLKISKRAIGFAELRKPSALKAVGGKKKQKLTGITKLEDARYAGSRQSAKCCLILTEGDSAKTMAMDGLQIIGRDYFGVFPLKGKPLNARNASDEKLSKNDEFVAFMKIMGLQPGVEYEDASQLRYGSVMLMTDQDLDGFHIKGVKINNILHMWPSLFKIPGFVKCFVTPIVKLQPVNARSRRKELMFFNMSEFQAYKEANTDGLKGMKVRYLKGLGSSEPKEARAYFADFETFVKDYRPGADLEVCKQSFEHAFSDAFADWRKQWLSQYDEDHVYDYRNSTFDLEQFVDRELKHFSIYDNQRSLGSVCDGLKISQRKVLWALRKMNLWNDTKKVLAISGEVSSLSSYHHGEKSLMDTTVGMAQHFVGSNNVNLLFPSGQFGSRLKNGSDAADPRYIFTRLNHITKHIFRQEDDPVLRYEMDDEGKQIEPKNFVPIVAMVLVNGCSGIGTGYACDVPMHNPVEVVDAHIAHLQGRPIEPLKPWFRGFRGTIKSAESSKTSDYMTEGAFERVSDTTVRITELPVGQAFDSYKEFLETHLLENAPNVTLKNGKRKAIDKTKYFIKEYESQTFPTRCDFSVTFPDKESLDALLVSPHGSGGIMKKLKLSSNIRSNMYLFTEHGAIAEFKSVESIVQHHSRVRLDLYARRKEYQLHALAEKIAALDRKSRFLQLVLDGVIKTHRRPKREIAEALRSHGLVDPAEDLIADANAAEEDGGPLTPSMKLLLRISLLDMTEEEVAKFLRKIEELKQERAILETTSPEQIWLAELQELRKEMLKFLKDAEADDDIRNPSATKKKRAVKRQKT